MYAGDILIVVVDSEGNIITKKAFGIYSETDSLHTTQIVGGFIYFYGVFEGSSYQTNAKWSHYLYKVDINFSEGSSCSSLPITD